MKEMSVHSIDHSTFDANRQKSNITGKTVKLEEKDENNFRDSLMANRSETMSSNHDTTTSDNIATAITKSKAINSETILFVTKEVIILRYHFFQ